MNRADNVKIAYIGGGSRGWAWCFMSDLSRAADKISGIVNLYDIDCEAALDNEKIGALLPEMKNGNGNFRYKACKTLEQALEGADFVVISILPATFDEMESDVHAPEKYGIYQSVGDTAGPAGVLRTLRSVPMFEVIAHAVEKCCPDAWVINYTNPMTLCVKALYDAFPNIKAYGCCHEVFDSQRQLAELYVREWKGQADRRDVDVNIVGVNHFTWLTSAVCHGVDMFPLYEKMVAENPDGYKPLNEQNWINKEFKTNYKVKFDLFRRYGYMACAGDRHLAEFCPGDWYLKDPETVDEYGFGLTSVKWRKQERDQRYATSRRILNREEDIWFGDRGEEGVNQIMSLLGLGDFVTNVNLPNRGQIPNAPLGAVVETNAAFSRDSVVPVDSGNIPENLCPLVMPVIYSQEALSKAARERDLEAAFNVFASDRLVRLNLHDARKLFDEMVDNTKEYLTEYIK